MRLRRLHLERDSIYVEGTDVQTGQPVMFCLTSDGDLVLCDQPMREWFAHEHNTYELDGKVLLVVINNLIAKGVIKRVEKT